MAMFKFKPNFEKELCNLAPNSSFSIRVLGHEAKMK